MKIAYVLEGSVDEGTDYLSSVILEDLLNTFGFQPKMDVPFCLSYYGTHELDSSVTSICGLIYQALVFGVMPPDEEGYNPNTLVELIGHIRRLGHYLDFTDCIGVDLLLTEEGSRILLYFNELTEA